VCSLSPRDLIIGRPLLPNSHSKLRGAFAGNMSLRYGLNVKKAAPPPRRPVLEEDDDEDGEPQHGQDVVVEEEITSIDGLSKPKSSTASTVPGRPKPKPGAPPPPPKKKPAITEDRQNLSSAAAAQAKVKAAEDQDASIFDYDSFHDAKASVTEAKKAAARQEAIERKPKYINNLLDAAARRKQDQLIAREKLLQKEREAEGDEFADKEKFVTGAYKAQQEEARRLEAEEKKRTEEEEERRRKGGGGGGMQSLYRGMMEGREQEHREALEAAEKMEKEGGVRHDDGEKEKTDAELAAELRAQGVNVHLNEEGQLVDKRELLSAGLNVAPTGKGSANRSADHLKASNRPAQSSAFPKKDVGRQQASRERQSRMMEEQLAAQAKRRREEEEEERQKLEKAAKSQKTEKDVSDAKARYLARKAARESGKG
jgi:coiled-coil domain-containing protein 55